MSGGGWIWWLNWRIFPLQRLCRPVTCILSSSLLWHNPSRGPSFCLMDKRTHKRVEHVEVEDIYTWYVRTKTWRHMRRHTLWHLSSCCALRTCSNTLHPSTPLSLQLLSPPLALILFLPPPNAPHVPWGGLSLIFSHLSISCHRHLPLFYLFTLCLLSSFWVLCTHSRSWSHCSLGMAAFRRRML